MSLSNGWGSRLKRSVGVELWCIGLDGVPVTAASGFPGCKRFGKTAVPDETVSASCRTMDRIDCCSRCSRCAGIDCNGVPAVGDHVVLNRYVTESIHSQTQSIIGIVRTDNRIVVYLLSPTISAINSKPSIRIHNLAGSADNADIVVPLAVTHVRRRARTCRFNKYPSSWTFSPIAVEVVVVEIKVIDTRAGLPKTCIPS